MCAGGAFYKKNSPGAAFFPAIRAGEGLTCQSTPYSLYGSVFFYFVEKRGPFWTRLGRGAGARKMILMPCRVATGLPSPHSRTIAFSGQKYQGSSAKGMKFHLYQIPEEGVQRTLEVKAASLERLAEAFGPQAGTLTAHLFLRQRGGNVEVKGTLTGKLAIPCHRCLEPLSFDLDQQLTVTLVPEQRLSEMDEEISLSQSDLNVTFFDGETIELSAIIEDEALLAVPDTLCGEDDQGNCEVCGKKFEDLFQPPPEDPERHPMAELKRFLK